MERPRFITYILGFCALTMDQLELTIHSAGQRISLQTSLSERRLGLVSAEQSDSDTSMVSVKETFCRQMTFRVRLPRPQVLEQGDHFVTYHLEKESSVNFLIKFLRNLITHLLNDINI